MSVTYNAEEILEIACQIERNGARFYRQAAELVADAESRKLLLELAGMEDDHERTFTRLRADITARTELLGHESEEAVLYLRAVAGAKVFPEDQAVDSRLKPGISLKEILRIAIAHEKDSIVYYQGVRDLIPPDLGKDKVEAIIKEEMSHVVTLSARLAALSD